MSTNIFNEKKKILDFGYDISDYLSIQPEYGTMEDFDELIARAKELGMTMRNVLPALFSLTFSLSFAHPHRHKNHSRFCAKSLEVNFHAVLQASS